jgi:hypothetical protein
MRRTSQNVAGSAFRALGRLGSIGEVARYQALWLGGLLGRYRSEQRRDAHMTTTNRTTAHTTLFFSSSAGELCGRTDSSSRKNLLSRCILGFGALWDSNRRRRH